MPIGNLNFLWVSVRALERIEGFLDHAPILLTTGTPKPPGNHRFKFELGWLQRDGFMIWSRMNGVDQLLQCLQYKGRIIKYVLYIVTLVVGYVM
jgi:hypothetical protein